MNDLFYNPEKLLEPDRMILLYAQGAFPMADEDGNINWYMPNVRTIIPLDAYNVPRTLKKFMLKSRYTFKFDEDPMRIVEECSKREETWINDELFLAYERLKHRGFVHSVEVYDEDELIGGLYGVAYKGAFFGESMFSRKTQASKSALVKLIEHLNEKNFDLLDVQFLTDHLKMFGAKEISFKEFNELLIKSYDNKTTF